VKVLNQHKDMNLAIQSCFKVVIVLVSFGEMQINEEKHGEHN
jgi:hypothetical protein